MRWRRVLRRVLAWSVGPPLVLVAGVIGTSLALLYTPPGRALTARTVTEIISARVAGTVAIGAIRGSLLRHVVLEEVSIHDSTGAMVLDAPRIEARYQLLELLAGRIVIRELDVQRPQVHLKRLRRGRWNYQEVFRAGGGDGGGAPPRVELRQVTLHDATIRVDVPTSGGPPKQPISRNGAEPAQPETAESDDGLVRIYRARNVDAHLPLVRISTPRNDPILVEIGALQAELSDPALRIVAAEGQVITKADSLRFTFSHAALPGTVLSGGGVVRWPQDTIRYDFALEADTVALRDLRWVQPDFPDWTGRGTVTALSTSNRHTDFTLDQLQLAGEDGRASGRLVAMIDEERGFGVRGLDLLLDDVSLEVMRPYLDTLPLAGRLSGRLAADGYRSQLRLTGTVQFTDALAVGRPTSAFNFSGDVAFGGAAGAVFRNFVLRETQLDLATVQVLVPAVTLPGELRLVGRLDGEWQNATFQGTADHDAPNGAHSRMIGTVRFDTRRDILGLGLDARFDRLSFDGLRTGYPGITPRGGVTGHLIANGPLDSLAVEGDLTGDIGDVVLRGVIGATAPRYEFTDLVLDVRRLDVEAVLGRGENTAINGRMVVNGVIDTAAQPVGEAQLDLGQSRIGGLTLEGVAGTVRSDGQLMYFDSLHAEWDGGGLMANGSLGWTAADSGRTDIVANGFALAPFDSLARATLSFPIDSATYRPLAGTGRVAVAVTGSLANPAINGEVEAKGVQLDDWSIGTLHADVAADSLSRKGVRLALTIDSLGKGRQVGTAITLDVGGTADSMTVRAGAMLRQSRLAIAGWRKNVGEGEDLIGLDSLRLDLPRQQWLLDAPATLLATSQLITLRDTMTLRTDDGSGLIVLGGSVPGVGSGTLEASIIGLDLADIYAVLGRDTAAVGGLAQLDFRLGGTRAAPLLRGNAMITGPRFGEASPPLLRAAYDYADRTIRGNLTFWRLGEPVLEVDATLPFDLALAPREERRLPGPIEIHAMADSADLSILEAFTSSVRSTNGAMTLDLEVGGTWNDPELSGRLAILEGRTTIPNLGVRYGPIRGAATFAGDSLLIEQFTMASDEGELAIGGSIRFEDLRHTVLNLELSSRRFLAINVPGFLVARPTGEVTLTGPLTRPVLRGNSVSISSSDIYFADIINKNIIDLEDPRYRDLVDIEELRRQRLGTAFQNRFLDSLRIENLRVVVGSDVWLRSAEAEIQLEGAVQVSKTGRDYIVAGGLNTPRGEYTLNIRNLVNRKFTIDRGTVTYLGTADLNAELDIQATYRVRSYDGDEIPIVARITGTILLPEVALSSPGYNIPERDIWSYLVFGRSESQLAALTSSRTGGILAIQTMLSTLSSALERHFVQESGVGLDLLEIRPGVPSDVANTGTFHSLAAGVQLGSRWFVTVNAGFCFGGDQAESVSARNFGASIEYRFARDWRLQASAEPVQSCIGARLGDAFNNIARRYQLGADLFWEREY